MSFDDKVLYLRLSPEFGGTRFGHFEQRVVRLGSDPGCDIAIAQGFGVAPEHVQVLFEGPNNIIVAPADRAADVYLWKPHAPRPELVTTPTAIRPGESFALATPTGPRFIIELDDLPEDVLQSRGPGGMRVGGRKLTAKSMGDEVKRQAFTSLLVTKPAQLAQKAVVFIKSGAFLQPRNIILAVTILGGYVIGATSFCSSRRSKANLVAVNERYDGCQEELAAERGGSNDPVKMKFSDLANVIVGSTRVESALKKDRKFGALVKERPRAILSDPGAYDWMFKAGSGRANQFVQWRTRLMERDELDGQTVLIATWLGASPYAQPYTTPLYERRLDSESNDACVRGNLGITYRQAVNLGLTVQLDAFHRGTAAAIDDTSIRKEMLGATAAGVGEEIPEDLTIEIKGVGTSGKEYCIYAEGDDNRDRRKELLEVVARNFAKDSPEVPLEAGGVGITARVARFYAAELPVSQYDASRKVARTVNFMRNKDSVTRALEEEGPRGDWVLKKTADVYARAIAVPCIGVLDPDKDPAVLAAVLGDRLPNAIHCLVLNYQLNTEG